MGMSLIDSNGKSFGVNWTGWSYLRSLLKELKQDTSEMSGISDGDHIEKGTINSWGKAIMDNLKYIKHHKNTDIDVPVVIKSELLSNAEVDLGEVKELDNNTKEWLIKVATFFIESDGVILY